MRPRGSEDSWEAALRAQVAQVREAPALRFKARGRWRAWTWREIEEEVASLARAVAARGEAGGRSWGVLGPVTPRALALSLAVARGGGATLAGSVSELEAESWARWRARGVTAFLVPDRHTAQSLLARDQEGAVGLVVVDDPRGLGRQSDPRLVAYHALRDAGAPARPGSGLHAPARLSSGSRSKGSRGAASPRSGWLGRGTSAGGTAASGSPAADDEVFLQAPTGVAQGWAPLVEAWLRHGFVLTCAEAGGDTAADRRVHQPTVLAAEGAALGGFLSEVESVLPRQGTWSHRVWRALWQEPVPQGVSSTSGEARDEGAPEDRARQAAGHDEAARPWTGGQWTGGLWTGALRRRLRSLLGLSRTRLVVWAGDPPAPEVTRFFARLGLPVGPLGAAPRLEALPEALSRAPERTRHAPSALASDPSL